MPKRDGTGPEGEGPLTGRGLGIHGKNIPFNGTTPLRNINRRNQNFNQKFTGRRTVQNRGK
jgi:hypothetical protein